MMNIYGGGARTNEFGLKFEQDTSLNDALLAAGYTVSPNGKVKIASKEVAISAPKHELYRRLLEPRGVSWKKKLSKKLLPDDALFVYDIKALYIIEKKFQHQAGSVDEKLQTCDFKKKQYQKLVSDLGWRVEYLYVCNDWFTQPEYEDVRNYVKSVGCHIYFNAIPLDFLGLPPITEE